MTKKWMIPAALVVSLFLAGVALANGTPSINWWVMGGGGSASAGSYSLDSTVGQAVVGTASNGGLALGAGFWGGAAVAAAPGMRRIYLPLILKSYP